MGQLDLNGKPVQCRRCIAALEAGRRRFQCHSCGACWDTRPPSSGYRIEQLLGKKPLLVPYSFWV